MRCHLCKQITIKNNFKYCQICRAIKEKEWRTKYNTNNKERIYNHNKERYQTPKTKERILQQYKEHYQNQTPEVKTKLLQQHREYYKIPKVNERILQQHKQNYQIPEIKKKIRQRHKKYYSENKDKILIQVKKYRLSPNGREKKAQARIKEIEYKNSIIHSFTYREWLIKKEATKGICPICKQHVGLSKITMDHKYSKYKAYLDFVKTGIKRIYTIDDVEPMCNSCNSKKHIYDVVINN